MADPKVKHITGKCPVAKCNEKAFVQVLIVEDAATQRKIDTKARAKLRKQLNEWHKEGQHD